MRGVRLLGAALALALGAAALSIFFARPAPRPGAGPAAAAEPPDPLEGAALARFSGRPPKFVMPDGKEHVVTDPKAARGLKIELLKGQLAREEETRDPTFRQRTEAEVRARAPMRVMLSWDDLSGGGTIEFTVADSRTCGLPAGPLDLNAADLPRYACLDRPRTRNRWEGDARLKLLVTPVGPEEREFQGLVREEMKVRAATAYLARQGA